MAKKIAWTATAKADVRAIDQQTALRVVPGLARFVAINDGDVKNSRTSIHQNRCDTIEVMAVKHRSEAYR
jgi:hypothetical protein